MENYYIPSVERALLRGRLIDPVRRDTPYQTIATDDIGKFAALAFARPDNFIGIEFEIAGSELTNQQAAEVFGRVLGRPVRFSRLPLIAARITLGTEFFHMFRWLNEAGYQADVAGLHARYPELKLKTLEDWLHAEGWSHRRETTIKRDKLGRQLSR